MDPSSDDIADTMTAAYRTMRSVDTQLADMRLAVNLMTVVLTVAAMMFILYAARKVWTRG